MPTVFFLPDSITFSKRYRVFHFLTATHELNILWTCPSNDFLNDGASSTHRGLILQKGGRKPCGPLHYSRAKEFVTACPIGQSSNIHKEAPAQQYGRLKNTTISCKKNRSYMPVTIIVDSDSVFNSDTALFLLHLISFRLVRRSFYSSPLFTCYLLDLQKTANNSLRPCKLVQMYRVQVVALFRIKNVALYLTFGERRSFGWLGA